LLSEGCPRAVAAARAGGSEPVRRLAGGRAAAIGPGTACVGWASPSPPLARTQERYEVLAAVVIDALRRLGIEGRVGELPGEWCPGAWSVIAGEVKVGGLAQRMIRGGAWAEAVVVVSCAEALRGVLDEVEQALGSEWRPETLTDLDGVTVDRVRDALVDAARERWDAVPAPMPRALWSRAEALRGEHVL
jgi:lipoate-protein ligase A